MYTAIASKGGSLVFGPIEQRRFSRLDEIEGPADGGRMVTLRPAEGEEIWWFGWIGSAITLQVDPRMEGQRFGPPTIWYVHMTAFDSWRGMGLAPVHLGEDGIGDERHVDWEQVPSPIRMLATTAAPPPDPTRLMNVPVWRGPPLDARRRSFRIGDLGSVHAT